MVHMTLAVLDVLIAECTAIAFHQWDPVDVAPIAAPGPEVEGPKTAWHGAASVNRNRARRLFLPQSPRQGAAELEQPAACEVVGTAVGRNKKA
jgi:hypothetical protein